VLPGAAKKIFDNFLEQSKHRRAMETKVIDAGILHERLGVICGAAVAALAIIGGVAAASFGSPWAAGLIGGSASVSLAGAFLIGQYRQQAERRQHRAIASSIQPPPPPRNDINASS